MFKKVDQYIIKTFFGPFLMIFSVLFFIFLVNILWIKLAQFTGKGLSTDEILKLLLYMGVKVVQLVLPLTILLAAIMTFGGLGERYELAALKAAGVSLWRIMMPLFGTTVFLALVLLLFSNNIIPQSERKAKNMMYNIAETKPALNFTPGQFLTQIPKFQVKFDSIYGPKQDQIKGIFIHKVANNYENNQNIMAKTGVLGQGQDRNYLKLTLNNGYMYEDQKENKDYNEINRQPYQSVKFDRFVLQIDVSELIKKAIDNEKITDYYKFQDYFKQNTTIDKMKAESYKSYQSSAQEMINQHNYFLLSKTPLPKAKRQPLKRLQQLKPKEKSEALEAAYQKLNDLKESYKNRKTGLQDHAANYAKIIINQQNILVFSATCIIFFFIGAPLGSIIRKGGLGLPVVMVIIIFIIFHFINLTCENYAWKGLINPYLGAWLPNLCMLPLAVFLTKKAIDESQLFDMDKYIAFFKPLWSKIIKNKEHQRYQ
jgi:lipopolysaccharide export system permease protein